MDLFRDTDESIISAMWITSDDYIADAFARTTKPGLLQARMFAALSDPKAHEAADLTRRAGLKLPPGWLFPPGPKLALVPTLAAIPYLWP